MRHTSWLGGEEGHMERREIVTCFLSIRIRRALLCNCLSFSRLVRFWLDSGQSTNRLQPTLLVGHVEIAEIKGIHGCVHLPDRGRQQDTATGHRNRTPQQGTSRAVRRATEECGAVT